jgi:hypothetical protein
MAQTIYRVLEGCEPGKLEEQLNAMADEGWELRELFPTGNGRPAGYDVIWVRRQEAGTTAGFHAGRGSDG